MKPLVTLTYIILGHESPARIIRLANKLLEDDPTGRVIIHFDKKSPRAKFVQLKDALGHHPRCQLMENRVRCGWGQWGLVEAPLRAIKYSLNSRHATDYYYLLSEYCYPVRPLHELKEFLSEDPTRDFIECFDSSWIKGGIREDRYLYRHYLDKRKYPKLHRWMYRIQKYLGLKRKVPEGLEIKFGSQWWCLSQNTVSKVAKKCKKEADFLKVAWVPDEMFFQTLAIKLNPEKLSAKSLTYYKFNDYGVACLLDADSATDNMAFFKRKLL